MTYDNVNLILSAHAERLSQAGTAHLELVVLVVAVEARLDVAAQVGTVLYPHTVLMVYLHHDAVVGADADVNQEILFA